MYKTIKACPSAVVISGDIFAKLEAVGTRHNAELEAHNQQRKELLAKQSAEHQEVWDEIRTAAGINDPEARYIIDKDDDGDVVVALVEEVKQVEGFQCGCPSCALKQTIGKILDMGKGFNMAALVPAQEAAPAPAPSDAPSDVTKH
jgi:hypothetical protein